MAHPPTPLRERAGAAILTLAVVAGLGWALVTGLGVRVVPHPDAVMQLFTVAPPPPPPPPVEQPPAHSLRAARDGASAPPNRISRATEVEAPKPVVPPIQPPPPVIVAPLASIGADASSGAVLMAGPGTGAGGEGTGTGNGRAGTGGGSGGTPARVVSGPLRYGDLPAAIRDLLAGDRRYEVVARYTVTAQGRVTDCRVIRSSGMAALDAATCRAMTAKLRYRPERDADGRAVPIVTEGYQTWDNGPAYAPDDD